MNTPPPDSGRRQGHWDLYWSAGHLHSLPDAFAGNYDGAVADFWQRQFESLPPDAEVLDLCSGNGAVALLAARHAERAGRAWRIRAVDAAALDLDSARARHPAQEAQLARIEFHGQCAVEELPFAPDRFDLLTSQYGVEYCAWDSSAKQVARVLKPGGRLVVVSHALSSEIFSHMELIEREYQLLDELDFFPSMRRFLMKKSSFQQFIRVLRRARGKLAPRLAEHRSPFLGAVVGMLDEVLAMSKADLRREQHRLRDFHRQFTAARSRQADMLRVHQRMQDEPRWHRVFEREGLAAVESGEISYRSPSRRRMLQAGDYHVYRKPLSEEA